MSRGQENTLIRGLFKANLQDQKIRKELNKKTFDPGNDLRLITIVELGRRNQIQVFHSQPPQQVIAIATQRATGHANTRPVSSPQTRVSDQTCENCGLDWSV